LGPLTLIFLLGIIRPASAGLPPGWSDTDIGSPADAGSATDNNGVWSIAGGGVDIGGTSDQFNFASQSCSWDGAIVALITSVQNTDPSSGMAKAGVMFRNDSTSEAVNACMVATAEKGVQFQYRATTDATTTGTEITGISPPVWVKVVRTSDLFSGYYSVDGTNWTQVGSTATILMAGEALGGLAVTAHNNSALNHCTLTNVSMPSTTFGIYRQLWTNLNQSVGDSLTALTSTAYNPNWPNNPAASFTHVFTNFETEINTGMNYYGQRLRAFVIPPTTGLYTFWIASDDTSQLLLSASENPAGIRTIATQTSYTASEDWTEFANQQSALISLQGGCRYYIEAQMQQGNGGDNLSVRWQLPNGVFEQPMAAVSGAGTLMIPYTGVTALPGIYSQSTNATVVETLNVALSVLVTNGSPVTYQWFDTNGELAGATLPVYTLTNASLALNNGDIYTCVISDSDGSITSAPIALTVLRDTNPPVVVRALNLGTSNVEVDFSKAISADSATNAANYAFTDGLPITGAALGANNSSVILTGGPLVYGSNYSIVINNIQDLASIPNTIASNTLASFTAFPFASQDIGSPSIASTASNSATAAIVTSGGSGIGASTDQFNFEYQLQTGNFDVVTRVAALGLSDLWAQAGLMARVNLSAGSAFAATLATPGINGESFVDRTATAGTAVTSGEFPVNYPNTWLRLNRVGNVFTGFASYDGTNWTQLGSANISMPAQIYLGMAVASASTNQVTTAQFVDFETTPADAVVARIVNPNEPVGPSSRKTGIVISEIMWKPAPRADSNNVEFLEIYNSCPFFQDISSYQVTCADMNFTFPANTIIPGGGYFVLAASPQAIANVYGVTSNVFGPYNGSLKHSETLEVLDEQSNVLLTVPYTDKYPWPVAASGTGHSIVLANPSYGEGDPRAWAISDQVGGSPGGMDTFHPSPLRNVVINEILPHTENPAVPQFIELYNHSAGSVDVSGCILTDNPATNEFVIPAGTVIGPAGFVSFSQSQFGFTLNGQGETLYFINPDNSRVLDAVQFGAQADGVSYGRWPDGANDFYAFTTNTPGTNNSPILIGDIVINELMYDPISGSDDDQYIELYNQGTNTIDLSGWQFTSGVTFTFPGGSVIGPNGYVVVGKNTANLFANYTNLSSANTYGNYSGKLSHDGELVVLAQPESYFGTNTIYVEEDEVTFGTGGRWGQWSGGGGSSLELIDPHSNHRLAANWADSDETQKSSWVTIQTTGVLDNGANFNATSTSAGTVDYAQIGLLDQGECLVDNIEVNYNGVNYVPNGTFENGFGTTWSFQGCMVRSSLENTGYQSSHSMHIRCSDKIWTGVNSCQVALNANSLVAGQTVTLSYAARWLRGWPEPLMRLHGNWLEATGAMPVPTNLGSPGAPNSQYVTNAGPALYNVTHTPTVPAASQPVVVTTQAHDPDGIQSLTLYYRLDPATSYSSVPMNDKGTGGDAIAGDGVYSATIPGQAANQVVAFYIAATDKLGAATRFPALRPTDNEPVRECVIMFGDGNPGGSFGVYHLWITQTNITRWANLSDLSNEGNDCTFVNNTRVIYNLQGRFAGSPYHQEFNTPTGSLCHYKWEFNDDDKFLGATDFNKIHQPGNGPGDDPSLQREECANTFLRALGVPWLYKRLVAVYVNGNRRGVLMEDTQVPGSDIVKEHFPNDSDGFLFKMQPWFEMAPLPSGASIGFDNESWCNLVPYTTTGGVLKTARYRYNFEMRRTPDSDNDYTDAFSLIDAANSYGKPNYVANMENLANMENWMRVFAANHAAGNWDSFGAQNAQNLYGYIGTQGTKYSLMMWDYNIVLGNSGSWGPGQNLFSLNGQDPNMQNIYNDPTFLRMYWRALQELVNGPLNVANSGPLLMAKYNAFIENGLNVENPSAPTAAAGGYPGIESWLSQAQTSIASQLAAVNATHFSAKSTVTLSNNVAYISGGAPVNVAYVWINGVAYPLTWTSLTNWIVTMPLTNGANLLTIVGVSRAGQPITGDSNLLNVNFTQAIPSPVGHVVINEIMYNPAVPDAQYVELFNNSTTVTYDLSGWQLQGLSYTFPSGSLLPPLGFLVLASNVPAFAGAYGATNLVFDTFSSALLPGQLLSLVQPVGGSNLVVAQVRFDDVLPWPTNANTPGVSLQLIDPHQDNWRVGNWSTGQTNPPPRPFTPDATNSVAATLPAFPPLWINEVEPDNLTGITNSAGEHAPWLELYNPSATTVTLTGLCLGTNYTDLTNWAFPSGAVITPGQFLVVFADSQTNLSTLTELHTSFALSPGNGSVALSRLYNGQPQVLDYVNYTDLPPDWSYGSLPDGQSFVRVQFYSPTPGASNANSGTPPASFIAYNTAGSVYTQTFDSLPDPGATSVNTANPVTIDGITCSLANPYDFAFPAMTNGAGGLGLPALAGWYGSSALLSRFGATDGDQTTGGQISFGPPNSSNRALGMLATSSTGSTAIGAKFINNTGTALNFITLQVTGEIWRQSNLPKTLQCYYWIDPTATEPMPSQATAYLPALNVVFPTVSGDVGGAAVDGTAAANETYLAVTNQAIANWPSGAALWLVWQMVDSTGKSQGLAIDNLNFSATSQSAPTNAPSLSLQGTSANPFVITWPAAASGYQLYSATNLSPPVTWSLVTTPAVQSNGTFYLTILPTNAGQFFRLAAP
jgi:regulation of enolase protein 1 (concanavalin A-like superfamily)